jgi:hypothetical protein
VGVEVRRLEAVRATGEEEGEEKEEVEGEVEVERAQAVDEGDVWETTDE